MKKNILYLIALLNFYTAFSQDAVPSNTSTSADQKASMVENNGDVVSKGNKLLANKQFSQAMPYWLKVASKNKDNANYYFKLGLCYLNSLDKQVKALPYLKIASKKVSPNYKFFDEGESSAPVDIYYFLGKVYMELNNPDSAINYFLDYKDKVANPVMPVERNIRMALNAKNMFNNPLMVKYVNVGEVINTDYSETNPVVTADGKIMYFASRRLREDKSNQNNIDPATGTFVEDIYSSEKEASGKWLVPKLFSQNNGTSNEPLCVSQDGNTLYFMRQDKSGYTIYSTVYVNGVWATPQKMKGVNSHYNAWGFAISLDNKLIVFASEKEGGNGKSDLYYCTSKGDGTWNKPKNMGSLVNTNQNEKYPFIHPSNNRVYYASDGLDSKSMGGYDIYYTDLNNDGTWSEPINAGYPINSTRDDMFLYYASDGTRYTSSINDKMNHDIYMLTDGQFDQKNLKPVIQYTKEEKITEIVQLEKEIEKEVEVTQIEEKEVVKEKEVTVTETVEVEKENPEVVKAKAEQAKAEAVAKQDEAEKMKAMADMKQAEAEKAKSDAIIAKENTEKSAIEAKSAKDRAKVIDAEVIIAEQEKQKAKIQQITHLADAEKAIADANSKTADAEKAKANAARSANEKAKAEADLKAKQGDAGVK